MDSQQPFGLGQGLGLSNLFSYFNPPSSFRGLSPPQTWAALNISLRGELQQGTPWPVPCFWWHEGKPVNPNERECSFIKDNYFNSHLNRSQVFGAYSATQFEICMLTGDDCQLDWTHPENPVAFSSPDVCRQGNIPNYFIDVQNAQQVMTAFRFAKETGIPLVIKNTGHDFKGRSAGNGALALWMHHMKYIHHVPSFVPEGCPADHKGASAITFGAGEQFDDIYRFAHNNGLQVVGGSDQSVGAAGGWGQGGGHSSLSPNYGMGADRTLQYKIVTPDGKFRIANACQHQDLFFALRGGGGGTFGVVLEATMMASPEESMRVANINWKPSNETTKELLSIFLNNATNFANQGWGGYLTPGIGNLILTTPRLQLPEAKEAMKALIEVSEKLGGNSSVTELPTYFDWFGGYVQGTAGVQDAIGLPISLVSRLVPQKNHATDKSRAELLEALMSAIGPSFFSQIHFTTPFGFKGSDGSDTSVNPIWRTSLYQIIVANTWNYNSTLTERRDAFDRATQAITPLRTITPDSGAYHNEADIHEPDWQWSFFNRHYDRLVKIKRKYDPEHILDCWQCVDWKGPRELRYACYI